MGKTLVLLRHAKSSWDDPDLDDFDRPLAPRGLRAAERMGVEIAARNWMPDRALVSPARRTRETARIVFAQWPKPPMALDFPPELYEAQPESLLECIRKLPERADSVMLIGHNPGFEKLALHLAGKGSDADARNRMAAKFPTAALARFEYDGTWRSLARGAARVTHFIVPKELS